MSAPRRIVPGVTVLLTRRCLERRFLLRPSARVNQIFEFCLAVAAERTGVVVHSYSVLSNHYHIVATDVLGNLPLFMHWLNEYVAKCVNAERGRWESFWAPGSYSSVELVDSEDVLDKLVYVFANPVSAGLVSSHRSWPGARSLAKDMLGQARTVRRPEGFFRDDGPVPKSATLRLVPPPAFDRSGADFVERLERMVAKREDEIRRRVRQEGRAFLGRRRVLAQSPNQTPQSSEPRRGLSPRIASRDKWRRMEALQRIKSFIDGYRNALSRYRSGDRQAIFPFGTYLLRIRFGVVCSGL